MSALHPPSGPHRSCSGGVRLLTSLRHPVLLALCTGRVWGTCVSEPLSSIRVHMGVYVTRLASSWLRRGSEAERTRPSWSEEPKAAHRPGPERPRLQLPRLLGGSVSSTRPCCRLRLPRRSGPTVRVWLALAPGQAGVLSPMSPGCRAGPWVLVRALSAKGSGGTVMGRLSANSQRVAPHCWRPQSTVPAHAPVPLVWQGVSSG